MNELVTLRDAVVDLLANGLLDASMWQVVVVTLVFTHITIACVTIFLHRHQYTASGATAATSGCISLAEPELLSVLRWLDPAAKPRIVMGPAAWLIHP